MKFIEQIRWKGIMQWCTGALMHWWCIVWHCSGALWICDSIEVQFYTLWKSSEIWEIVITFGDFDPQLVTDFIFQRSRSLLETLTRSYVAYFRVHSRQVNLSVGRSSQLALTSFLIQGKYFANQRYFEAQTRATGLKSCKHFSVAWTKLDWKYLQLCDAEQSVWKVMEFDFNRAHIAMAQSWNM